MEENTKPQRVSYTNDYISKLSKKKQFVAGWYELMTTGITVDQSKSGNVQLITRETPLRVSGDPDSKARQSITNYVVTPMQPEDNPDHEPPDSAIGMSLRFMRAKGIEAPEFPRKAEGGGYVYQGESISKEAYNEMRLAAIGQLLERLEEIRENPEEFEGYVCFAYVDVDGEYNKIKTMRAELPDGATLVDPDNWFVKTPPKGSNGANGHG